MSFATENGKQNRMSFLDLQIIHKDKTLNASVYCKPTFSGVYSHFDSFLPSAYKFTHLLKRCFRIFSSWTKLHAELVWQKQIVLKLATL